MKKASCFLLAALLFASALAGCGKAAEPGKFTPDNEIVTYQPIDPAKTQIVVSRTGNISVEDFCRSFEALNPDVQVVYLDITGGNSDYKPLVEWLTRGYRPDIVFSGSNFFDEKLTPEYFENLSTHPATARYEAAALFHTAVESDVYSLPGPSGINAMMYNKTLFQQYGWEVPNTFDEFVALCDKIRGDTGGAVEPWNPNAKYSDELLTALEGFTYEQLFGGAENRAWYNAVTEGKATLTGHMEPYMQTLQTLIDHGILRPEHFTYSATTRGNEFAQGKIAMINVSIYDADNESYDFGYMPYPTTEGELGYLCGSFNCYVGLPIKEHSAKERDAIDRFLDYFSSPQGQQIYIGNTIKVSNVKGVSSTGSDDLAALQAAIDAGHMFTRMNFTGSAGQTCQFSLQQYAMDMCSGLMTGEECLASAEAKPYYSAGASAPSDSAVLATVPRDMTVLETSFYIADVYRQALGADIGLIANNLPFRGNVMRMFSGEVTEAMVPVFKPRSFENNSALVKLTMTGSQLLSALNAPVQGDMPADCIYACSGLKCRVAPWNAPGEKYLSVQLAGGAELEPDKLYTVAAWSGTVAQEYITDTVESYEGTWEQLMTAALRADGTIVPAGDGRIELVWT